MNAPEFDEHIRLDDGEEKLTYKRDEQMANAGKFEILKEDHTLGNVLRMQLLKDPRVLFAGYRMPHPLVPRMVVQVRTAGDGTKPVQAAMDAVQALKIETDHILASFESQLQKFREDQYGDL